MLLEEVSSITGCRAKIGIGASRVLAFLSANQVDSACGYLKLDPAAINQLGTGESHDFLDLEVHPLDSR